MPTYDAIVLGLGGMGSATLFHLADRSGIWPFLLAGCHCSRDTGAAIEAAGFEIERVRRLSFNGLPHILGVARA